MNALAIVQGIVRLTRADTTASYAAAVHGRVHVLARAHSLLSIRGWRSVPLDELIRLGIEPFGRERITLSGPSVAMSSHYFQPLTLVRHELIANTATHGALSTAQGEVQISWDHTVSADRLALVWRESGGKAPLAVRPRGYGERMIEGVVKRQLGGAIRRTWRADGLTAEIELPVISYAAPAHV